jgi:hypothetical protein
MFVPCKILLIFIYFLNDKIQNLPKYLNLRIMPWPSVVTRIVLPVVYYSFRN